jgi:Sugar phosphate permease
LVCKDSWLDALAGSIVFIGWAIGIVCLGYLSDRFGRRKVMYPAMFLTILTVMAHAFVNSIWQLIVIRFIMGFVYSGPSLNQYVLSAELVGPKKRVLSTTFASAVWPIGAFLMTLKAYYIQDWRYLSLACSIPYLLGLFTCL